MTAFIADWRLIPLTGRVEVASHRGPCGRIATHARVELEHSGPFFDGLSLVWRKAPQDLVRTARNGVLVDGEGDVREGIEFVADLRDPIV